MSRNPTNIAHDILGLADTTLFDPAWYLATYAGTVAPLAEGGAPLVHFCDGGWRTGLRPNPVFDTSFYLAFYDDVRDAGMNPLLHYLNYGDAEGRRPAEDFDPLWYRRAYQVPKGENCLSDYLIRREAGPISTNAGFDVAWYRREYGLPAEDDPFLHYKQKGAAAGFDPSPEARSIAASGLFDAAFYRRANAIHPAAAPVYHFCNIGWRTGCPPNPLFDPAWYLDFNPDVRAAQVNPLYHYITVGEAEGRAPCTAFDPVRYRETHEVMPFVSSLGHRLLNAIEDDAETDAASASEAAERKLMENSGLFDVNYYLANYPDVRESTLEPAVHFLCYGWSEGRRPNPYFDSAWYARTYLEGRKPRNPLLHYIVEGEAAGNRPVVYFDPKWYVQENLLPAGESALAHFLRHRRSQYISPTPLFDVAWYMERHGAAIGPNRDPFAHYLRVGISGDVSPGPDFDAVAYRRASMEARIPPSRPMPGAEIIERLRREAYNPLVHFLLHGSETQKTTGRPG